MIIPSLQMKRAQTTKCCPLAHAESGQNKWTSTTHRQFNSSGELNSTLSVASSSSPLFSIQFAHLHCRLLIANGYVTLDCPRLMDAPLYIVCVPQHPEERWVSVERIDGRQQMDLRFDGPSAVIVKCTLAFSIPRTCGGEQHAQGCEDKDKPEWGMTPRRPDERTLALRCFWMCGAWSGQRWMVMVEFERGFRFSERV